MRQPACSSLIAASLLLAGCYASHGADASAAPDPRFADDWLVTARFGWALIETTTVYRLRPDGSIEVLRHSEGIYFEGEAGQWALGPPRNPDAVHCAFGGRWWSEGDHLFIDGGCTDGSSRPLELRPVDPADAAAAPFELEIVSPPGATGYWEADGSPGALRRCGGTC